MGQHAAPGPHREPRRQPRRYITTQAEHYANEALRSRDTTIMLTLINFVTLAINVALYINR